ncbi:MAG: PhnD/SsuA/transferrin family substrate-binding protein [Rhizobiales bacterium]|nr:PhnD/SsuA/transferrin family substrate-binding protein [Hyphomicrobiales bacterium]
MAKSLVPLKIAVAEYPHTKAILSGRIPIEGIEPQFVNVVPQIAAYRRMVREVEFDVCELAPTTYIIARAHGAPFAALPIFVSRAFHHGGLLVRPDAGIKSPRDLEGMKVGVRAYSVTTGVWTRGILIDDYGLDSATVTWVVDDEEHVRELRLPPNVVHAPEGTSLVEMMAKGEISAGFSGNAGLGRAGKPTAGWDAKQIPAADYPELFPDAKSLEAAWFKKTGIYPMHGTIVVKDSVLREHPWVARSLHEAYSTAKAEWLSALQAGSANAATDQKYRELMPIVGDDPLPFGIERNRATIQALESYAFKQELIPRRMSLDELFVDPELM